jgi:hypothetical protein
MRIGPSVSDGSDEPPLYAHDFLLVRTPDSTEGHGTSRYVSPASSPFEVAPGIQWGRVRPDIAAHIVEVTHYREPFEHTETLTHGFVRLRTPVPGWDDDNKLTRLLFLSHLVQPNRGGFEYSARLVTNEQDEIKHCYVGNAPPFYGRTALPIDVEGRWWLTDRDMGRLRDLSAAYDRVRPTLADTKLGLAISTYAETPFMHNIRSRGLLLLTMLEGLVNTGNKRATKQFTCRVKALAKEVGFTEVDREWADKLYSVRSTLAHGDLMYSRAPDAAARNGLQAHYLERLEVADALLRFVMQKALLEDDFRKKVLNPDDHWKVPLQVEGCPTCRAGNAKLTIVQCTCGRKWE